MTDPHQRPTLLEAALIVLIGSACGLSPFFYGFYDLSVWGPITLLMLAGLLGLVIGRPAIPSRLALAGLGGIAGLCVWAYLSIGWAESAGQALTEANRWLLYVCVFAIALLIVRDASRARLVIAVATAPIVALGVYLAVRMAFGSGSDLFVQGRLDKPLGYINGQAGYLLIGFWPLVAAAERLRSSAGAGLAVAGATLLAGLVVLTQTRAVVPAAALSAVLVVAALPGRARRLWVLVAVTAGIVASLDALLDVYSGLDAAESPSEAVLEDAGRRLLISAALAGAAWALAAWGYQSLRARFDPGRAVARFAALVPLAVLGAGAALALADTHQPFDRVEREYRAFVDLESFSGQSTRFTSGGGNRYDYWRVAWKQFTDEPVRGLGAGNYDTTYFLDRRTAEDIRQPHSIELQALAELGVVGFLALAVFLVAVLVGFARRAWEARHPGGELGLAVAAGGTFLVWATHTSVDWLHLLPGATGIALCSAAALVGPPAQAKRLEGRAWVAALVASGALVVFGSYMVGSATLAERWQEQGQDALARDPERAIDKARDALAANDEDLASYYLLAAGEARLGRYEPTRAALFEATRREPRDHVTWALLGDVAVRRGDLPLARAYYEKASRLNPRSKPLAKLARNPRPESGTP